MCFITTHTVSNRLSGGAPHMKGRHSIDITKQLSPLSGSFITQTSITRHPNQLYSFSQIFAKRTPLMFRDRVDGGGHHHTSNIGEMGHKYSNPGRESAPSEQKPPPPVDVINIRVGRERTGECNNSHFR